MAKSSIGWGLIGSTSWSDHTFGPAISAAKGGHIAAVFSSKRASASAFCAKHKVPNGYTDLDDFLADSAIDVVWVAGPTDLHYEQTIAALEAGKHVLCEKPMAVSAADCAKMVKAAEKARRILGLGYNNRHHPIFQAVQKDWVKGKFGTPIYARAHVVYPSPDTKIGWRGFPKRGGGWALGNIGTHLIDLVRMYMGDVTDATGHLSSHAWGLKVDDFSEVSMAFKNGASATITAGMGRVDAGPSRLELFGTKGWCIFEGAVFGAAGTTTTSINKETPRTRKLAAVNTYKNQVAAFNQAVAGKGRFMATGQDGLANVKVMEQARGW
ncbi:MAG: Gfo/Idh/MocA family oxidoreductase [Alphaproteobacteria bacterium]|nr:Gfo/Idh/MocA family oxidoreductase [Alphaproteobacteria bacterium]